MAEVREWPNVVGINIKRYRDAKGMSQYALAAACRPKIDRSTVNRIENTGGNYSHDTLMRIAEVLGVNAGVLYRDVTAPLDWGSPHAIRIVESFEMHPSSDGTFKIGIRFPQAPAKEFTFTDGEFTPEAFAFVVRDDGMRDRVMMGDTVIVEPHAIPETNNLVLAAIYRPRTGKTDNVVRRYAERTGGLFELLSTSSSFSPEPSAENVRVVGVVSAIRAK